MLFTTCCFILFFPNCLFRFWCFLFCLFVLPFDLTTSSSSTSSSPFIVMITKITVKFQIRHRTTHIAHSNRTAKFQRILSTCDVLFFVICWNRVVSSVEWCAVAYNFFLPDITNVHFFALDEKNWRDCERPHAERGKNKIMGSLTRQQKVNCYHATKFNEK